MSNPNATIAGGTSGAAVGVVWFLGNVWPHAQISAELGAAIAGGVSTILLFLGRNGAAGVWRLFKFGSKGQPAG